MSCQKTCTPAQVNLAFKKAEQFIDGELVKRVPKIKKFWSSYASVKAFPDGVGLKLDKVRLHLDPGVFYDGYDGWRTVEISRNGNDLQAAHDSCGFRPQIVGHGMETLSFSLMERDFATTEICLKDIRTFYKYKEVQDAIFGNLANITASVKEQLARNAAMSFAVKHIAIPGLPYNHVDPYSLPNINGATVGRLNERLLNRAYQLMCEELGDYAVGMSEGMPLFGVVGSPDTFDDLMYEDPEIRADIRSGIMGDGVDNALIKSFGFSKTFRDMFVFMNDWNAPRYKADAAGNLIRVFPRERNIDIEIGSRSVTNPEYINAQYELLLFFTKDIMSLRTRRALTTVGGKTKFGSEPQGLLGQWAWHNPETSENPFQRAGKYITTMEVGVEPGDAPTVMAVLVQRRPERLDIQYWGDAECVPEGVCDANVLPDQVCPCPMVESVHPTINSDQLLFVFDKTPAPIATETLTLNLSNGTTVATTVISKNGTNLVLEFATDVEAVEGLYVSEACIANVYSCTSDVVGVLDGGVANSAIFRLNEAIRAQTLLDQVTVYFGDGTTATATVSSVNLPVLEWTFLLSGEDLYTYACEHKGVKKVCVADAPINYNCPACSPSSEACVDETA